MNGNQARADRISKRTGKPHIYVYKSPNHKEWMWEGHWRFDDSIAEFCDYMDKVYGWAQPYNWEFYRAD